MTVTLSNANAKAMLIYQGLTGRTTQNFIYKHKNMFKWPRGSDFE